MGAASAPRAAPRIMALILTHNAPESLRRCLDAVAGQSTPPGAVLVVDNASTPAVDLDPASVPGIELMVVRSEVNSGPAGGWATALGAFLESDYRHAWVLDDDMRPEVHCLERLWSTAAEDPGSAFVFPVSQQADGSYGVWPSWCGFVIAREIVEEVGLPKAELFWWAEDTEYLQWRIPDAGYERRVGHHAVVFHDAVRQRDGVPLWKYYYESRNMLWIHLHVKHRIGRYPRSMSKLLARAMFREDGGRLRRLGVIGRGLWDGARGRLGIRYAVEPMQERGGPAGTAAG